MPKFSLKPLWLSLASSIIVIIPNVSQAKPIIYDFNVNVTEGSLQGNSFSGFFIYDDETLEESGREKIGVEQGLSVCMTFFDKNYDETDDSNYPEFPQLVLNEGQVESLDFWAEKGKRQKWWNREGWTVNLSQRESSLEIPQCLK
jgi:hypothetical protein